MLKGIDISNKGLKLADTNLRLATMRDDGRLRSAKIRGSLVIDLASAEAAKKEMARDATCSDPD